MRLLFASLLSILPFATGVTGAASVTGAVGVTGGVFLSAAEAFGETRLDGNFTQGGLVIGTTRPGTLVMLDEETVRVSGDGLFVLGFHRDAAAQSRLVLTDPDGAVDERMLTITPRDYDIQRIDGLPPKMVTPPAETLERIRREGAAIKQARMQDMAEIFFRDGFLWPAEGRISGVYGSQRILNGEPRRPHFGIDIAGPVGTPVIAPAGGIIRLAEADLYYSGGTIILDHGHGLSSAFLHLESVAVKVGDRVRARDLLGTIGATGRVTGPHLDWRINWFEKRLDPGLLVPPR